jgi:hypothetical protein
MFEADRASHPRAIQRKVADRDVLRVALFDCRDRSWSFMLVSAAYVKRVSKPTLLRAGGVRSNVRKLEWALT